MTNIKKIGLTALAASLVSTSVSAGAISVSGGASLGANQISGNGVNSRTSYSMGNQLTFTGGGELENGLNVSVSFVLDQSDAAPSPFDGHSLTLSSAAMGALTFSGEGGSSASDSIGSTVSGNIWDNFDGTNGATDLLEGGAGDNSFFYTTPSLAEGLSLFASVDPGNAASSAKTNMGYGATFTGVGGLSVSAARTNIESKTPAQEGTHTVYKATYAFGPITAGYAKSDYEIGTGATAGVTAGDTDGNDGQEATSISVSYTINENLSISYGSEVLDSAVTTDQDANYQEVSVAYTTGGVTISALQATADNVAYGTAANQDLKYWELGASFAF